MLRKFRSVVDSDSRSPLHRIQHMNQYFTLEDAVTDYEEAHNVRIDYARPQSWFDAVRNAKINIDPREYVWVYTKDNMTGALFGQPMHKDSIIIDAIKRQYERDLRKIKALSNC